MWAYPDGVHDLSNTQYAVFGLKVGTLHGYRVPRDFWRSVSEGVLRLQARDGGFRYRFGPKSELPLDLLSGSQFPRSAAGV